jgi:cytochrome oxidase assembly protein ShyY1
VTATSAAETPARPSRRSWRFLASPGWIGAILAAIAFTTVCWAVLAPWQFSRHAERATANAQVAAAANAEPRRVDELLFVDRPPDAASTWQPATATGTFEPEHQVYVRLRQDAGGAPASEVVVPLRLADGSAVLIDRGYVGAAGTPNDVPLPELPSGTVTVTGRVQPDQPDPLHRAAQATDGRTEVLGIDATAVPDLTGPVRQGFLQLVDGSPGVLTPIGVPQVDEGPFLSYALQWCAFGGMALLAIGFFVVREYRDPRPSETPEAAESAAGIGVAPRATAADRPAATGNARRSRQFDRSQLYDRAEAYDGDGPDAP